MNAPRAQWRLAAGLLLIRAMVGGVFLSEGIQKFLFPDALGVGRFIQIGLPSPALLAPFVGIVEIACGALLLLGLYAWLAALPLLVDMAVAIATTKVPILLQRGFWSMAHEARTDYCMVLGALTLFLLGGGAWSVDAWLQSARKS